MTGSDPFEDGVVVSIGRDKYRAESRAGGHTWKADEPVSYGGADTGPSPYQLLLSGLGACKAMTVRMYADRKGWDLDEVHVALRHERRHADDCDDCESDSTKITHIDTEIQFTGNLTGEQRERLREIAGRCPVEKTITGDLRVVTELVESE